VLYPAELRNHWLFHTKVQRIRQAVFDGAAKFMRVCEPVPLATAAAGRIWDKGFKEMAMTIRTD
jgi:hypothetical protein